MCLHTNLHDQTSHFHLYVNAEYVNRPHTALEEELAVGLGFIISTPFGPVICRMLHSISFFTTILDMIAR